MRVKAAVDAVDPVGLLVALPAGALIGAWQRREDLVGEGFQESTDRGQRGWCAATHSLLPGAWTGRPVDHALLGIAEARHIGR